MAESYRYEGRRVEEREKLISSCVAEKKEFKGNGADCGDLTSDRVFVRGVCNPSSVFLSYFVRYRATNIQLKMMRNSRN